MPPLECTICAVFFQATAECVAKEPGQSALVAQYEKASENLILIASDFGNAAGIKKETIMSRVMMARQEFQRNTNSSCANFSVLIAEYARKCEQLAQNPTKVFEYYLGRAASQ